MDVTGDAPPLAIDASQSVERAGWLARDGREQHTSLTRPPPPPSVRSDVEEWLPYTIQVKYIDSNVRQTSALDCNEGKRRIVAGKSITQTRSKHLLYNPPAGNYASSQT
jgi:hypothetical protein